jgi:RNA polymerase-binding protein DksA
MTDVNQYRTILQTSQVEFDAAQGREALTVETSPDELDRIQSGSDRDYAIGSLERRTNRLREINDALLRLDEGSFGTCASCERPIPPRRLAAIPWARLCVACQEAEDRSATMQEHQGAMAWSEAA